MKTLIQHGYTSIRSFRYRLQSGNNDHPLDRLNAAVEVRPVQPESADIWTMYNTTSDGLLVLGHFNDVGIASGMIDAGIGKIKEIRLNVLKDSENWVILSEVNITIVCLSYIVRVRENL